MRKLLVFSLYYTIINSVTPYTFIGTEESLRQNLDDLLNGTLIFSKETLPHYDGELFDITPRNNSQYDFIIVGAGSAGSTLAARLSEIKHVSVLLIEAGGEEYPLMDIPRIASSLGLYDQINWRYYTERSKSYCLGSKDQKCFWSRGKVTGGGSTENYMMAMRGNKANYDEWAWVTGDRSWSYKNMLKYFKKLENFYLTDVEFNSEYRNRGGPMHITSMRYNSDIVHTFINAGRELGFREIDYNAKEKIGFAYIQQTVNNGERWSTNRGYLYPAKGRPNLFFTRNSFVNKILIDEKLKLAYGVEVFKNGKTFVVKARNEVILSAGAINSPQILMLSGIGSSEHLRDLGITIIKEAPVGKNLMDHPIFDGLVFETNIPINHIDANILDPRNPSIKEYIDRRNGTLAIGPGSGAVAFVNVDDAYSSSPNIEILFNYDGTSQLQSNGEKIVNSTYSINPVVLQPKSRGKILLRSKNPRDKPKIYANYFQDPEDIRVAIKGIRISLEITKTKTFKKYDSRLIRTALNCANYTFNSDSYWECALRYLAGSISHASGSCKMGRVNDPTAVVNSKLKVIGIKGLRVIDASIMPNIVSAHTNIPTIAIAEKGADMIKEDWGYAWNFQGNYGSIRRP